VRGQGSPLRPDGAGWGGRPDIEEAVEGRGGRPGSSAGNAGQPLASPGPPARWQDQVADIEPARATPAGHGPLSDVRRGDVGPAPLANAEHTVPAAEPPAPRPRPAVTETGSEPSKDGADGVDAAPRLPAVAPAGLPDAPAASPVSVAPREVPPARQPDSGRALAAPDQAARATRIEIHIGRVEIRIAPPPPARPPTPAPAPVRTDEHALARRYLDRRWC
jgi:hypothetical protein